MKNIENKREFTEYNINGDKYRLRVFETARTPEENYLIGYLLGDGGYNAPTHKRNGRLYVSSSDEYIIRQFRYWFQPDSSIDRRIPVNNTRNIASSVYSSRMTFSSKFTTVFTKYGIMDIKENRTFHNIAKYNMRHFLLGLFDSDGHISWGERRDRNRLWANIGFTHPSLKMLEKLQRFLESELSISSSITLKKDERCYVLRFSKLDSVAKFINYIYSDKPKMYLTRKYESSIEFLEKYQ